MNQQKVGRFLKTLRNNKSITQTELAEVLGVSNRSISRWENGTTMPDFDLLIELAKYYEVEVGEILDGERKAETSFQPLPCDDIPDTACKVQEDKNMDNKTEELMLKIADYNNGERDFFSKRMGTMFLIALVGMAVYMAIDVAGLAETKPYEAIVNLALGFVVGTLLTGLLYTSRYSARIKAVKMRLMRGRKRFKD